MISTADEGAKPQPASLITWLVEMGVDELLLDQPQNRLVASAELATPPLAKSPVAPPAMPRIQAAASADVAGLDALPAAEALAAGVATIADYEAAIAGFDSHPLRRTASRACVLGGNLSAKILVLCDKPRNEEDRTGLVLAGNNQVLAQRMLAAIGLTAFAPEPSQDHVAVTNLVPWRPPGNRNPTELEVRLLVPLLRKLVALLQPKAILCLGHLPGQYLAEGEDAIGRSRGRWLSMDGIPLLTTFHPDTLLKSPASKRLAWQDLQSFQNKLAALP